ncbi:hypothetical protein [Ruegeria sp. HKCCD9179]|uniref:hypothetical protein n=1 Tax=Ruegeria sp. HKCCD9179 TaxID=2683016 RepID=UPI00148989FA|nr:hypothetical protein [Ruegeria sp. HKCCD9179]
MQEPFDWEQAMETTRRSATAASQNSENAVAGMSKLLREIDRHSSKLSSLTKIIDRLADAQDQQVAHTKAAFNRAQGDNRHSCRLPALGLLAAFAVGVVFGGFIVS